MNGTKAIHKVAVIGAGIAGLACARELQSRGISVDIFEKSSGPSGRMSTRRTQDWSADHGAQYFTARDPRFIQEVQSWIQAGTAATWKPKLKVYEAKTWRESHSQDIRYVGIPHMNSPGKHIAENLSIQYDRTISKLERRDENGICIVVKSMKLQRYTILLCWQYPPLRQAPCSGALMRGLLILQTRHR
jgi:predicted NAD/FAD-dependent oxidoreductase